MIGPMMAMIKRILFLLGIVLAVAAFLVTATELAARAIDPNLSTLASVADVWRTVSADSFEAFAAYRSGAVLEALFKLPGWLVLGLPGLALIIGFRERDGALSAEHEQSLFLFDELSRQAREDGYDGDDDLSASDHPEFIPADPRYGEDDFLDDLIDAPGDQPPNPGTHDFLLADADDKTPRTP